MAEEATKPPPYNINDAIKDFKSSLNILFLETSGALTAFILYYAIVYKYHNPKLIHIIMCTVGYVLLMTCAIILYAGQNIFGRQMSYYQNGMVHLVVMLIGSVLGIAGSLVAIITRDPKYSHFIYLHEIFGLVSIIFVALAVIQGILSNFSRPIRLAVKYPWWKVVHNVLGFFGYLFGMISIIYGFDTWWFNIVGTYDHKLAFQIVSALLMIWTLFNPILSTVDYIKTAVKQE